MKDACQVTDNKKNSRKKPKKIKETQKNKENQVVTVALLVLW